MRHLSRPGESVYDAPVKGRRVADDPPSTSGAPARTVKGHEARSDVDVDVVHIAVRHDAPHVIVSDEPADHFGLSSRDAKVDRLARGVFGGIVRSGDLGARTAGRDDLDVSELGANARQQVAGIPRQARGRCTRMAMGLPARDRAVPVAIAVVAVGPGMDEA